MYIFFFKYSLCYLDEQVLLSFFRLPGEAQKIDRIMECFSTKYIRDNPSVAAGKSPGRSLAALSSPPSSSSSNSNSNKPAATSPPVLTAFTTLPDDSTKSLNVHDTSADFKALHQSVYLVEIIFCLLIWCLLSSNYATFLILLRIIIPCTRSPLR